MCKVKELLREDNILVPLYKCTLVTVLFLPFKHIDLTSEHTRREFSVARKCQISHPKLSVLSKLILGLGCPSLATGSLSLGKRLVKFLINDRHENGVKSLWSGFFQINHVVFLSNNKDFGTDLKNKEVKPITSNTRQQKIPVILVLPLKQCKSRQTKHFKRLSIVWGPPGRWETGYLISVMKPLFIPANKLLQKVKVSVFCWIKKKKKKKSFLFLLFLFIILIRYYIHFHFISFIHFFQ